MSTQKKWNILFIEQENSSFNSQTEVFSTLFNKVDKVPASDEVLEVVKPNLYDMIIADISVDPEGVVLLTKIKEKNAQQTIFALVSPKDADKLYKIANSDINAFELTPDQFDLALEEMAKFDPYAKR